MKLSMGLILAVLAMLFGYLLLWPTGISPVAWQPPVDNGFSGKFVQNRVLQSLEFLSVGPHQGPEDLAIDREGRLYAAMEDGSILRTGPNKTRFETWAATGGRPLGLEFAANGNLVVADAHLGLLSVEPSGKVTTLVSRVDNLRLGFSDGLSIAKDGIIYFTDASTKFDAQANGGVYAASLLDLIEHGGHGRVLAFDPNTGRAWTLLGGLQFANGITLSEDEQSLIISETGRYRIIRYWLAGGKKGQVEPLIENLPGFPDNVSRGPNGRYWAGLASPRSTELDAMSGYPFLRKIGQRLPSALHPKAIHYSHVFAFNDNGEVLLSLQDPDGGMPLVTGALETEGGIFISSVAGDRVGWLSREYLKF